MVPPHGVGVHVAQVVDVGHVHATAVAAPGHQALAQRVVPLRQTLLHPLQQIGAVGVVVAGDVLLVTAVQRGLPGTLEQQVHRGAGGGELRVLGAVDVAAAGVVQVREIELVRALLAHQRQQGLQVVRVAGRHGVTQAHLHAARVQVPYSRQAAVEGALQPAELVVGLAQAIDADAHIVEACSGHPVGHGLVDQRAVGRETGIEAHGLGTRSDVEDIGPHQRLTAREDEHGHLESLEVVHHGEDFRRVQLARVVMVGRERVAMLAGEVAAADQIPDDDRATGFATVHRVVVAGGLGQRQLAHVLGDAEHRAQPSAVSRKPVFFRIAVE